MSTVVPNVGAIVPPHVADLPVIRGLLGRMMIKAHEYHLTGNWDYLRYGPCPYRADNIPLALDKAVQSLQDILREGTNYQWLVDNLADNMSREWVLDLLCYRIWGAIHVKLPLNTPQFWQEYETIDSRFMVAKNVAKSSIFDLNHYRLPVLDQTLEFLGHPLSVLMLRLGQYYYDRDGVRIVPQPGDVIIDGGGCWGEAALDFAVHVGDTGHVYSFEFVPNNVAMFRKNMSMSPQAAKNVTIVERAISNISGQKMPFRDIGPATVVGLSDDAGLTVETISIDDFVAQNNLTKVDFIKLDIEGSEHVALAGAVNTIRRFRPRMAICLYHRPHDLFALPQLVRQIESRYELHIDHYTLYEQETVLYARVP